MTWDMTPGDVARRLPAGPHIVLHDRVAAREPVLVAQPLEDPVRRVPLLARYIRIRVRLKDRIDDAGKEAHRSDHRVQGCQPDGCPKWRAIA